VFGFSRTDHRFVLVRKPPSPTVKTTIGGRPATARQSSGSRIMLGHSIDQATGRNNRSGVGGRPKATSIRCHAEHHTNNNQQRSRKIGTALHCTALSSIHPCLACHGAAVGGRRNGLYGEAKRSNGFRWYGSCSYPEPLNFGMLGHRYSATVPVLLLRVRRTNTVKIYHFAGSRISHHVVVVGVA
jgi:tRNA(Arg) A34 adenosine deaminase TadA